MSRGKNFHKPHGYAGVSFPFGTIQSSDQNTDQASVDSVSRCVRCQAGLFLPQEPVAQTKVENLGRDCQRFVCV